MYKIWWRNASLKDEPFPKVKVDTTELLEILIPKHVWSIPILYNLVVTYFALLIDSSNEQLKYFS